MLSFYESLVGFITIGRSNTARPNLKKTGKQNTLSLQENRYNNLF